MHYQRYQLANPLLAMPEKIPSPGLNRSTSLWVVRFIINLSSYQTARGHSPSQFVPRRLVTELLLLNGPKLLRLSVVYTCSEDNATDIAVYHATLSVARAQVRENWLLPSVFLHQRYSEDLPDTTFLSFLLFYFLLSSLACAATNIHANRSVVYVVLLKFTCVRRHLR